MPEPTYINRYFNDLESYLLPGKVLIIYGPRQVGKTTLLNHFLQQTKLRYRFANGDNISIQTLFSQNEISTLTNYIEGYELLVIDEAQEIPNIGQALKILVDHYPSLHIIATGSSTFNLRGQIGEPLTGRQRTITLFPLAQLELAQQTNRYDLQQQLPDYLIYGSYPEIVATATKADKREQLIELSQAYLLKDILALDKIKNPKALLDLLRLLAYQVGNEVSHSELAKHVMLDTKTVARYLDLLEKCFVLYNLRGFSRNLRKEITKKSKYYFYDLGIRNALIANFKILDQRNDIGQLWENFLIIERLKKQAYQRMHCNNYFWRTWDKAEIDFIEERDGQLYGYEFKWQAQHAKPPKLWQENYTNSQFALINQVNYLDFTVYEN